MTTDLPAYLDAQLAAIEDTARAATPGPWQWFGDHLVWPSENGPAANDPIAGVSSAHEDTTAHIATMDPAFTLEWCAAIRAVIALMVEQIRCSTAAGRSRAEDALRTLAQPFAGGEGWQEGWAL